MGRFFQFTSCPWISYTAWHNFFLIFNTTFINQKKIYLRSVFKILYVKSQGSNNSNMYNRIYKNENSASKMNQTHFVACNCVPQKMPLQDSNSTQAYNLCLLEWRWVSRPARVRNKDRSDFDKYCPQKIRQYWNIYIIPHVIFKLDT